MERAPRYKVGSVVFDRRRKTWNLLTWEDGKRRTHRIGTLSEYPSKSAARRAAQSIPKSEIPQLQHEAVTIRALVDQYRKEKMPERASTRRGYETYLQNQILPKWQDAAITDVQARPVELWLNTLKLAPKSKVHVRGLLHTLWDYAMWRGDVPTARNPMELVQIRNASKRVSKPRTMTIEEFHRLSAILTEPYKTMATVGVCLGLRWSEIAGLKWQDIDWIDGELRLQRAVVKQIEDEVKTVHSSKPLALDTRILDVLKQHRQNSMFIAPDDWVFASPAKLGRLPRSYTSFWEKLGRACQDLGIRHISPHSFRHSYRAWLDELGTPITVQQRAMRHGDIRVTMSYGETVGDGLREASSRLAAKAIPQ
jgi:integrase